VSARKSKNTVTIKIGRVSAHTLRSLLWGTRDSTEDQRVALVCSAVIGQISEQLRAPESDGKDAKP
jgi:hypothetical protein